MRAIVEDLGVKDTVSGQALRASVLRALPELIDPDRALRELANLAYSDVREIFDEAGNLRPIHTLPAHVASMIGGIEVVIKNAEAGDGHTDKVHKIKVWDKPKALQMLLTNLGLLVERVQVDVNDITARKARLARGKLRGQ